MSIQSEEIQQYLVDEDVTARETKELIEFLNRIVRAEGFPGGEQRVSCFSDVLLLLQAYTLRALSSAENVAQMRTVRTWFTRTFISNSKTVVGRIQASVIYIKVAKIIAHNDRILEFWSLGSRRSV